MRHYRDIIWKMAKGNKFLDEKNLRTKEALIPQDQTAREKLWPLIQKARQEEKKAGFIEGRMITGTVCPNAALVEPGFYAPVKYCSAAQASKAQRVTHGIGFLQISPLKVKLSTKQYPNFLHNSKPLSHSKCQDFANHFMGFNGWRTHIVTVNDIPWSQFDPDGQEENEDIPWELSVNM